MSEPYFKVKKLRENAIIPSKRDEDAAYDFYCAMEEDFKLLMPGDIYLSPTGIAAEVPKDWVIFLVERGSNGSKGLSRRCGVVDSGFRGEIFVCLNNTSNKPIVLARYDDERFDEFIGKLNLTRDKVVMYPLSKAVAQAMILNVPHIEVEEVEELDDTSKRGDGIVGSSGK